MRHLSQPSIRRRAISPIVLVVTLAALAVVALTPPPATAQWRGGGGGGSQASILLDRLESPYLYQRRTAARNLQSYCVEIWTEDASRAVDVLSAALDDPANVVRNNTAMAWYQASLLFFGEAELTDAQRQALEANEPVFRTAAPLLLARLDSPSSTVQEYLLRALATWIPEPPDGTGPGAEPLLSSSSETVRHLAAYTLGRTRPVTPQTIMALTDMLDQPGDERAAAQALAMVYAPQRWTGETVDLSNPYQAQVHADAIAALTAALSSPDPEVQASTARALGAIGSLASPAVPALGALASDPATELMPRLEAEQAIESIDGP